MQAIAKGIFDVALSRDLANAREGKTLLLIGDAFLILSAREVVSCGKHILFAKGSPLQPCVAHPKHGRDALYKVSGEAPSAEVAIGKYVNHLVILTIAHGYHIEDLQTLYLFGRHGS